MTRGVLQPVPMHGLDRATVERVADRIAAVGSADSNAALAARFGTSEATVSRLKQDAFFTALVSRKVDIALFSEGKPLAVRVLTDILRDGKEATGHRIRAAELILSRTMAPAQSAAPDQGDADLSEMSANELRGIVDSLEAELAQRATPVEAPGRSGGQAVDVSQLFN